MEHILVVIDMQNDFIDGSLGTKEAQEIVDGAAEKSGDLRAVYTERWIPTQRIT